MLSILIPTYNYNVLPLVENLHKQALQANISFEIIVLDDCSNTPFEENLVINELVHCSFLINKTNLGRTLTREMLARKAKYEILLFLDADVMPSSEAFIDNYKSFLTDNATVTLGGVAYQESSLHANKGLRFHYGISREQQTAEQRNKNKYGNVLSGNILINKDVFLRSNYNDAHNFYGMDILLAYNLYKNHIPVNHIDNPVYHLGLENNEYFFQKSLEAVKNRKLLLAKAPGAEKVNSLLHHYKLINRWGMTGTVKSIFNLFEKGLRKRIVCDDPNLFFFDLYRLGYICSIN